MKSAILYPRLNLQQAIDLNCKKKKRWIDFATGNRSQLQENVEELYFSSFSLKEWNIKDLDRLIISLRNSTSAAKKATWGRWCNEARMRIILWWWVDEHFLINDKSEKDKSACFCFQLTLYHSSCVHNVIIRMRTGVVKLFLFLSIRGAIKNIKFISQSIVSGRSSINAI